MGKEYVPIFFDWLETTQDLSAEEKGRLIDAVITYAAGGDYEALLEGAEKIAFRFLKGQIDRNAAISDARSRAGANKQEQKQEEESKPEQTETNGNKPEQTETKSLIENKKQKTKIENKKQKEDMCAAFDDFWNAYPRHTNKKAAQQAFQKLNPDDALMKTILGALSKQRLSAQWTKDGGQFIPHPATWLNGRRWEDEMVDKLPDGTIKTVSAQRYQQRDYTPEELDAIGTDWIKEAKMLIGGG